MQYLELTLREFTLRKRAYERMWCRQWEQTRWLGLQVISPYLKKEITPEQFYPLPTDEVQNKEEQMHYLLAIKRKREEQFRREGYKV